MPDDEIRPFVDDAVGELRNELRRILARRSPFMGLEALTSTISARARASWTHFTIASTSLVLAVMRIAGSLPALQMFQIPTRLKGLLIAKPVQLLGQVVQRTCRTHNTRALAHSR